MQNQIQEVTRTLKRSYLGIFVIAFLIGLLSIFILSKMHTELSFASKTSLQTIGIAFMLITTPVGLKLFHEKIKKLNKLETPDNKPVLYKKWAMVRLLLIGSSMWVNLSLFIFIQDDSMFFCAAISVIAMLFCVPGKQKMVHELMLDEAQED